MAKTYKIEGYVVDANGDDLNLVDIEEVLHRFGGVFGNLEITISPTWEWTYHCPENIEGCSKKEYERRFQHGN